jgi:hypothetical protein
MILFILAALTASITTLQRDEFNWRLIVVVSPNVVVFGMSSPEPLD